MKKTSKIVFLEYLRILSMLCVIVMHISAGALAGEINASWYGLNVLTSFAFIAVPIFFMISGVVLLNSEKTESPIYVVKKRLPKLIIPLFFWSMVVILPNYLASSAMEDGFQVVAYLKNFFIIPSRDVMVHLWFMYFLIPIYILSPFIRLFIKNIKKEHIKYFFIIWISIILLETINPFLPEALQSYAHISFLERANFLNGYLGYFLCGYFLYTYDKVIPNKILYMIILVNLAIISIGTGYLAYTTNSYNNIFQSVNGFFIVALSIAVFLWFKQNIHRVSIPTIINYLASLSFCVYLMHNAVIKVLASIWDYQGFVMYIVAMVVVLIVSLIIGTVVASIKWLTYIATGLSYKTACNSCNLQYFLHKNKKGVFKKL